MGGKPQEPSQTDWEGEGGAIEPAPKQKSLPGAEIPVPKRRDLIAAFRKIIQSVKKKS